ncbi:uncharacterized protein [Pagrus major]|uniref:uncharacterized protein n=1 Tax=Pagrus major TaxID=143350 RepID=UPI003CC88AC9
MVITIKRAIGDELANLSKSNFEKFCDELLDRREEPRVLRSAVEDKGPGEITQLLVETFTEPKALHVALDLLRQIHCNEAAQRLESKTKVSVDNGDPVLPKTSSGELKKQPSQEALNFVADQYPLQATGQGGPPVKKPEEVEADAKARVRSEGGEPYNARLVLSRFIIQFGQYKGQTFKWLLENDVGYAVYVVATHREQRKHTKHQNPLMAHKDSLTRYATAYAEVLKEVRLYPIGGQPSTASSSRPGTGRKKSFSTYTRY